MHYSLYNIHMCIVGAGSVELPVFAQNRTISSYLYQTDLPAMSEFTTCFWFEGEASDDRYDDFLLSISTKRCE